MGKRYGWIGLTVAGGACLLLAAGAAAKAAKTHKPAAPAPSAQTVRDCSDCPEMVVLPAGEYLMGSPKSESHRGTEAQHRVMIGAPFAVSRLEITFAQWDACVADGGCDGYRPDAPWGRGPMPVVNVNFKNAMAYTAWLSRKTGHGYRLLSESEWEYAARGGSTAAFAFGATLAASQANFDASSKTDLNPKGAMRNKAIRGGQFKPNGFGLYDMHGNVWEWVQDCWNDEYGPALPADGKPALTGDCGGRVLRGGSWEDGAADVRAAARVASAAGDRSWSDGIRVARDL